MKIMISQPMRGISDKEVLALRDQIKADLETKGHEVISTFFKDFNEDELTCRHIPLYYLADSLKVMADCDAVFFVNGWEKARGCRIEHQAAKEYGLKLIYQDEI